MRVRHDNGLVIVLCVIYFMWPMVGVGGDYLGCNAHVARDEFELAEREFNLLRNAGIRQIRVDFDWSGVEKRPGEWDFSRLDRLVELAERSSIRILPILDYDVPWARPAIRHLEKYCEYVRRVVGRYHDRIRVWEVWNEPDSAGTWGTTPSARDYVRLLEAAAEEIRTVDPDLTILSGGMSRIPWAFWEEAFAAGIAEHCDAFNLHPYRWEGGPEAPSLVEDLKRFRDMMERHGAGNKPVWITEIGWPTHRNSDLYWRGVFATLLEAAGVAPEGRIILIDDPQYGIRLPFDPEKVFPEREFIRTDYEKYDTIHLESFAVLIPTYGEGMPLTFFDRLLSFIAAGGTVLLPGGGPLYYDLRIDPTSGEPRCEQASETYREQLRIGWKSWWRDERVPEYTTRLRSAHPAFPESQWAHIYLDGSRLEDGDQFLSLAEGVRGNFSGTVAGVIRYHDGGALGMLTGTPYPRSVTEELQAAMLVRSAVLAASGGAARFFWYELQSTETSATDKEAHFGLLHRDLSPKPAFAAAVWLNAQLPAGAEVTVDVDSAGNYRAAWRKDDDVEVQLFWRCEKEYVLERQSEGQWFDLYGKPLSNASGQIVISPLPVWCLREAGH